MISDELLNKFNSIEDLPVSEELLGAYMEGNLDYLESAEIASKISDNIHLSNFVKEISICNNSIPELSFDSLAESASGILDSELELPLLDELYITYENFQEIALDDNVAACLYEEIGDDLTKLGNFNEENNPIDIEDNHNGDMTSDDMSFDNIGEL